LVGTDIVGTNMADQDELAQLEAERDRLLSMIAYHNRPLFPRPPWFDVVAIILLFCGTGILIVAGILAGQIPVLAVLFAVVSLPPIAYIMARTLTVFGATFQVEDVIGVLMLSPTGRPAGERETHQRLADCEARITKLKEGRL
jgi:hypothetical protein